MTVQIIDPLPEDLRDQAAEVLYEAFREKMVHALGSGEPTEVLARGLVTDRIMVAVDRPADTDTDRVLGVAAIADADGLPLDLGLGRMVGEFGILTGPPRALIAHFLQSSARPGELELSFIGVAGAARGRGIGQQLMAAVAERARSAGLGAVRLEVVSNNPRARALYERLGYRKVRTVHLPLIRPIVGFSGYDEMLLDLGETLNDHPDPNPGGNDPG